MKGQFKRIKTGDRSSTYFSPEYGEAYHSLSGAINEAFVKYCQPCRISELAATGALSILDVGFGLGYNMAAAIYSARKSNPACHVNIISLEKDILAQSFFNSLDVPDHLIAIFEKVKMASVSRSIHEKKLNIQILEGDARNTIRNIEGKFDAIFFDPFSVKKNPEIWTVEFFKELKKVMTKKAVLATYSSSTPVRTGMLEAGLKVGRGPGDSMKKGGTTATIDGSINFLSALEIEKLRRSPERMPYHDPNMNMTREEIISRREGQT